PYSSVIKNRFIVYNQRIQSTLNKTNEVINSIILYVLKYLIHIIQSNIEHDIVGIYALLEQLCDMIEGTKNPTIVSSYILDRIANNQDLTLNDILKQQSPLLKWNSSSFDNLDITPGYKAKIFAGLKLGSTLNMFYAHR